MIGGWARLGYRGLRRSMGAIAAEVLAAGLSTVYAACPEHSITATTDHQRP
jgi:hypothetical protein